MTGIQESERIAALRRLKILDTPPSRNMDQVTRLAAAALSVPIVLISLVDEKRQWFKSRVGLDSTETPRAISFCAHAVIDRSPLVVNDAALDIRFATNPMVTGPPHVRAYAGIPLYTLDGHAIGALCAIDRKPRNFTAVDMSTLRDAARAIENLMHAEESVSGADTTAAVQTDADHALREYIRRRAEFEETSRTIEDRFRASSEYAPVLVSCWNDALRCQFVNDAHAYWLDQPRERAIGLSMQEALGSAYETIEVDARLALQGREQRAGNGITVRDTCSFRDVICLPDHHAGPGVHGLYLVLLSPSTRRT